jgi:pimeloyl-ACP methyl ester carboxylesterase
MGSADLYASMLPVVTELTAAPNADFKIPDELAKGIAQLSIGSESEADIELWASYPLKIYVGEAGRVKLRQSIISLLSRESLHLRFGELKTTAAAGTINGNGTVPFLIIRGTEDALFSKEAAEKDIGALALSGVSSVQFEEIQGGHHCANWNKPEEVNALVVSFVKKYGGKKDARALREMVGMVDI